MHSICRPAALVHFVSAVNTAKKSTSAVKISFSSCINFDNPNTHNGRNVNTW